MDNKVPELEATLKTADELWVAFKRMQLNEKWAKKEVTDKIGYFQSVGYSDFITKYAVPTRYMVMYGEYCHRAFNKYLLRLRTVGYQSKSDWVDRQADYVKLLWRSYNPRGSAKDAGIAWQGARDSIGKEMDGFETDYERAKVRAEERRKAAAESHRELLKTLCATDLKRLHEIRSEITPVEILEVQPVAEKPALEVQPVAEKPESTQTESQRRNAARRKREKIKRAIASLPEPVLVDIESENRRIRAAAKESAREARRKENSSRKTNAREMEKTRMREKWESAREPVMVQPKPIYESEDEDIVDGLRDE